MLTPTQQLEQLRYISQALDYIEPALRDLHDAGHKVEIVAQPGYASEGAHIRLQMFESSADRDDAAGLAALLGWTEYSARRGPRGDAMHHQWRGVLKSFRTVLAIVISDPLVAAVPLDVSGFPSLERALAGGVQRPQDRYSIRPADEDMRKTAHETGCTVAEPCLECKR